MKNNATKYAIFIISLAVILLYIGAIATSIINSKNGLTSDGNYLFSDFCHHYIISCGLAHYEAKDLYAYETLEIVKVATLGSKTNDALKNALVLIYPPTYLFIIGALRHLPYLGAYIAFMLPPFLYFLFIGYKIHDSVYTILGFLCFPATFICLYYGQTGFILAALLTTSFYFSEEKPIVSGILLGLAFIKPHFCILLLVSYLASKNYKALIATAVTLSITTLAAGLVFHFSSWTAFIQAMQRVLANSKIPYGDHNALSYESMYTLYSTLMRYGFSYRTASIIQTLTSILLIITTFIIWKLKANRSLKISTTLILTPFCTYFGYFYDLVVIYFALLFFFRFKKESDTTPTNYEFITISFIYISIFLGIFTATKQASQLLTPFAVLFFAILSIYTMIHDKYSETPCNNIDNSGINNTTCEN